MPRSVEEDVHASFVEFREESDKCVSVKCLYCHQVRAKNTTRQRAHLLKCDAYHQAHPEVVASLRASTAHAHAHAHAGASTAPTPTATAPATATAGVDVDASTYPDVFLAADSADATSLSFTPNHRINSGGSVHGRPSLGGGASDETPAKKQKIKHHPHLPEIPLREVHAAFDEFKSKDDDKTMSARCLYCNQVRAKNTSRQREHLMVCPGYQTVLKEKIPANNLRHQFDEDDVASSLAIPMPSFDLDFRLSIMVKPKLHVGPAAFGRITWVPCVGGRWAGRWAKGNILPGGQEKQTTVSETSTNISARYLLRTSDDDPALIVCTVNGWWTGDKEVMDKLQDPVAADNIAVSRYKVRVTMSLETGDSRYPDLNCGLWVGSGCRRGAEIVYDFYRAN